jgi:hypothetical protein
MTYEQDLDVMRWVPSLVELAVQTTPEIIMPGSLLPENRDSSHSQQPTQLIGVLHPSGSQEPQDFEPGGIEYCQRHLPSVSLPVAIPA